MTFELSRRSMLLGMGGAGAALGLSGCSSASPEASAEVVPFRGEHQSGILTPAQQQMIMVAFDMVATRKEDLVTLLTDWTLAAERMQAGDQVNDPKVRDDVPPDDTGETLGLGPGALSITCLLYTSPSPRDRTRSRMPSSA